MISDYVYHRILISRGNIISRGRSLYKREGLWSLIRTSFLFFKEICLTIFPNYIQYCHHKIFNSSQNFEFDGKRYNYFFHPYCTTWRNERTVAVPIIWEIIKGYEGQSRNVLEIGNMLSYYFKVNHDIVDKYEIMDGVINEDIVDFRPSKKYDLIVSILTLVEVGVSEYPKDPSKIIRTVENLRTFLSPGGQIVVVMGLGFNPQFDKSLENKKIQFTTQGYLKHIEGFKWKEDSWENVKDVKYDKSIPTARGLIIGRIERTKEKNDG